MALLLQQQKLHEKQLLDSQERNKQLQKKHSNQNAYDRKARRAPARFIDPAVWQEVRTLQPRSVDLFNEAELTAEAELDDGQGIEVKPHTRRAKNPRKPIPAHLPRVDVEHELDETERTCHCGDTLQRIGEDINEQLSIIPRQYFVVRHIRGRYACVCKDCARSAAMPAHPLPGAQVTPVMIAHIMVSKLLDGLPLYRQEKMAARDNLELPRAKLARWFIGGSAVFQPMINRLMDTFFSYDIVMSDDTRIRVLKTQEDHPNIQSALWIRRGGPPDKPVVLVDYTPTKSGEAAYGLLSEFKGTLVCDGATNFNLSVRRNENREFKS